MPTRARVPRHVGLIPDGNRRWAESRGLARQHGYAAGLEPGLALLAECRALGVHEVSIYGFTKENARRPPAQVEAFRAACVEFARRAAALGVALRAVGDSNSPAFPRELAPFTRRAAGDLRVNLLVNYGWQWDLGQRAVTSSEASGETNGGASPADARGSLDVSRVDLVVRWGGRSRLSGFLPLQCAYADLFVVETLWPDMTLEEFRGALEWYQRQEVTLGG